MADDSSQSPSAARLQGSGEIVHLDLGPRGHHWHFAQLLHASAGPQRYASYWPWSSSAPCRLPGAPMMRQPRR